MRIILLDDRTIREIEEIKRIRGFSSLSLNSFFLKILKALEGRKG